MEEVDPKLQGLVQRGQIAIIIIMDIIFVVAVVITMISLMEYQSAFEVLLNILKEPNLNLLFLLKMECLLLKQKEGDYANLIILRIWYLG
jgi:hypothetical protein